MRIAQVAPLYESVPPRLYGGTERVVSYLTEGLVRLGHEVTLFAERGGASDQARCIVRAGGLREMDAGGPASLENVGLLFMRLLRPFRKGGVRLEQHSGIPRGMPD